MIPLLPAVIGVLLMTLSMLIGVRCGQWLGKVEAQGNELRRARALIGRVR